MKRKKKIYLLLIVILGSLMVAKIVQYNLDRKGFSCKVLDKKLKYLTRKLEYEKKMFVTSTKTCENKNIIYILGGDQDSLHPRFQKASTLYHKGISSKILILSRAGTTEFDSSIGRNLTNDEWSIRELGGFNVRKEDIEVVRIQKGIIGTANEAMNLPEIVQGKGFNRLILVTSSYHTKRTITAFSYFTADRPIELFIYGSGENAGLGVLLEEYIKLFLYERIILPGYGIVVKYRNINLAENFGNSLRK